MPAVISGLHKEARVKVNYYPLGRPVTSGSGEERYTIRLPLWLADNVVFSALNAIAVNDSIPLTMAGRRARLEKRHNFSVLFVTEFKSEIEAREVADQIALGLIRLASSNKVAIQFSYPPVDVDLSNSMFRDNLTPEVYPPEYSLRGDETRTDGGIFPSNTCILPEHKRIWEYPTSFGRVSRPLEMQDLTDAVTSARSLPTAAVNQTEFLKAVQALWAACSQGDRRLQNILLITTLEALAHFEKVSNWTEPISEQLKAILSFANSLRVEPSSAALLKKLSAKIEHAGDPGLIDRIQELIPRAIGPTSDEAMQKLIKEINSSYGKRSSLVHGGDFLNAPPADANERLFEIVRKCLDLKIEETGTDARNL